jgi:hypothetical protein
MPDSSFNMWEYWRDKKGLESALIDYYPQTLNQDAIIKLALNQIAVAKLAINERMRELALSVKEDSDE